MPHLTIKLYPGRPEELKRRLAETLAEQVTAVTGCKRTSVSVAIEEVAPADWAEEVYRRDVLEAPGKLYVRPGYNPFESRGG